MLLKRNKVLSKTLTFMRTKLLRVLMLIAVLLIGTHAFAYDFALNNEDSKTIYYEIIDRTNKTVEVTYKNNAILGGDNNVYAGQIKIPSIVNYNSTIYRVRGIRQYAFAYCPDLTSVIIPYSVTSIGAGVFIGCPNLTYITIDGDNTVYDSRNNCNAIIETATNTLIYGCKECESAVGN